MMKSVKYLKNLQEMSGLNDTQLAKEIGITQGAIGHYKSGRRIMDDETCLAVAIRLQIDPMQVVGAACVDRAEKTGQHSLWEDFLSRMATPASALLCLVAVNLFLAPKDSEAAPALTFDKLDTPTSLYYVK